jgi:PadR family transcriptional regulator, regulatory protein PadR
MARTDSSLTVSISELLILRLLRSRAMYGYELAKSIQASSGEAIRMGEGVLYPLLHVLEGQGLLRSRRQAVSGRTRVYYAVTAKGSHRLTQLSERWRRISSGVEAALKEPSHA